MDYNLELERIVKEINENKAKTVCIQLADGLKPEAKKIVDYVESKTNARVFIWLGSCFGGCDIPNMKDIDLLVQFGHAEFKKTF